MQRPPKITDAKFEVIEPPSRVQAARDERLVPRQPKQRSAWSRYWWAGWREELRGFTLLAIVTPIFLGVLWVIAQILNATIGRYH